MFKIPFSISIYFVISILLFSSCASILNPKYQKVSIEHPEGSEILIDGYSPDLKKGKYLCRRDGESKQITITKDGFKDENITIMQNHKSPLYILSIVPFTAALFLPPFYDNLLKSRDYVKNVVPERKLTSIPDKNQFNKLISLSSFEMNLHEDSVTSTDFINYGKYLKGNNEKQKEAIGDSIELKELLEISSSTNLFEELIFKGYMDNKETSSEVQITAKLVKYDIKYIASYRNQSWTTYPFFGKMLRTQSGIEWTISNTENEVDKLYTYTSSGEFAYASYGDSSRLAAKKNSLLDAIEYGFIQLSKSEEFKDKIQNLNPAYTAEIITFSNTELDTLSKNDLNIIKLEKIGYDVFLVKNDKRVKISRELGIGRVNSNLVLDFVKDQPEIYAYSQYNIHKGFGFISSLVNCYNDFQRNSNQEINQDYFNKFGLITKKEWRNGPREEILKEKKYISGEIRQIIVTTQNYENHMATTSTTSDNFKVNFSYGNTEYKSGFLMKNLKSALGDDEEALAYIKKYRSKYIKRGILSGLGLSFFVTAGLAANDNKPFGLSDDATPFVAIPGVLLYAIVASLDRTYKTTYIKNAMSIYNKNLLQKTKK